jgi:CRP-like cAMP-binding protein
MYGNWLLDELSRAAGDSIQTAALQKRSFAQNHLIGEAGEPIRELVFPVSGLLSVVVELASGDRIEAGLIGCEGAAGSAGVLGACFHTGTTTVQIPVEAWVAPLPKIKAIVSDLPEMVGLFGWHQQFLLAQAQQSAACNAKHPISRRLASWLLRCHNIARSDVLPLTHEFLAQMLGVQRASVSIEAAILQDMGLISYRHGKVVICNKTALEAYACECHRVTPPAASLADYKGSKPTTVGRPPP